MIAAAIPLAVGWLAGTALMQLATESLRGLQRFGLTSIFDWLLVDAITATVFGVVFVTGSRFHYSTAVLVSWRLPTFAVIGMNHPLVPRSAAVVGAPEVLAPDAGGVTLTDPGPPLVRSHRPSHG